MFKNIVHTQGQTLDWYWCIVQEKEVLQITDFSVDRGGGGAETWRGEVVGEGWGREGRMAILRCIVIEASQVLQRSLVAELVLVLQEKQSNTNRKKTLVQIYASTHNLTVAELSK